MQFITENIETIITIITMIITWILGALSKKSPYINNNFIIIQNIIVGIIVSTLYYIITKDFNLTIAMSGVFAETGYNLINNIQKLIREKNNNKNKENIEIKETKDIEKK